MKRLTQIAAVLLSACLAAACLSFAACGEGEEYPLSGSMTFVIDDPATEETDAAFTVSLEGFTSSDRAADVLDALADEGKVCYEGSRGVYGLMLTALGVVTDGTDWQGNPAKVDSYILRQDTAAGVYLYIYTSVEADQADYDGMSTVEYGGETLVESMAGISFMTIEAGAVVYVSVIVYGA